MKVLSTTTARWLFVLSTTTVAAMVANACTAGDGSSSSSSSSSGSSSNGNGGDIGFDGGTGDGGTSACAAENFPGELAPLDIYVMLDQSSSMSDSGKWSSVINALTTFAQSPESNGIGVGIQYFPVPPTSPIPGACTTQADCGLYGPCLPGFNACGGSFAPDTSCDPLDYDEAEVAIAELPGVSGAFVGSLNAHSPTGAATPTEPAMIGAASYATAWAAANPTHLTFIVFATDGEPTGCTTNSVNGTAAAAQGAASASPPVKTFVVGVGSELGSLNQIAIAGGTNNAFLVDTGGDVTQQFIDKLNEIRALGACSFLIPVPESGTPDFGKVNVALVDPNDPNNSGTIFQVPNEGACDPVEGGWYYDDPNNPTVILLCPATCDEVKLSDWDIQVLLGCTTVVR